MARFRRRKSRGTWFPMLGGTVQNGEGEPFYITSESMVLTLSETTLEPVAGVIPVTYDEPQEPGEQSSDTHGIADFIGNEYIVSRILGQCFIERTLNYQDNPVGQTDWPGIIVTAAFFVARAEDGQTEFSDNVPVGWDAPDAWRNYSPQHAKNIRQPWMWRRSWILGSGSSSPLPEVAAPFGPSNFSTFPVNNVMYGNMSDHRVDIKSKRRIHQDERLWFIVGARTLATALIATVPTEVHVNLDIRAFGQLRKARNTGSF